MTQIQVKWTKSCQKTLILAWGPSFDHNVASYIKILTRFGPFCLDLGQYAWIWVTLLKFEPLCLELGHFAWIWAIWQNLGQNRPQRRRSPEDGAGGGETNGHTDGRTDGRTDRQIPPVFYRTSSPSGPLPCFLSLQITIMQIRATGIADHILPLGDLLGPILTQILPNSPNPSNMAQI